VRNVGDEISHRILDASTQNETRLRAHHPAGGELLKGRDQRWEYTRLSYAITRSLVNTSEKWIDRRHLSWLERGAIHPALPASSDRRRHGDSHLKALLIHHHVIVPVTKRELDVGTGNRIFYSEFSMGSEITSDRESYGE